MLLELLHFTPCHHAILQHLNNITLPCRYTFEYPASWKNDVVNKVRQLCSNAAKHSRANRQLLASADREGYARHRLSGHQPKDRKK